MNIMQCALHPTKFSRVSSCATAKEMWDKLQVIYEGISEVRETKANMFVSEFEAFKMKQDESISDIFSRLTILTNGLKSLEKSYSEYEIVTKILRSLTSAWHTKATVIEESRNLSSTTIDELIGSLMTYELNLKRTDEPDIKKKSLALKGNIKIKNLNLKVSLLVLMKTQENMLCSPRDFKSF